MRKEASIQENRHSPTCLAAREIPKRPPRNIKKTKQNTHDTTRNFLTQDPAGKSGKEKYKTSVQKKMKNPCLTKAGPSIIKDAVGGEKADQNFSTINEGCGTSLKTALVQRPQTGKNKTSNRRARLTKLKITQKEKQELRKTPRAQ